MARIKILLTLLFLYTSAFGQTFQLSENARISILTCGTGPEVYALFGHTAIRVNDPQNNIDIVYNYGAFDFATPNFTLKFIKGDLQYFATWSSYADFITQYNYEQRSVYEQVLNVPQPGKQRIFDHLNGLLQSDERFYTYKFIERNCTNMASAEIGRAFGNEKFIEKKKNTDISYRETLYPYFSGHFYEQLGSQVLFGTKADQQARVLFLPFELKENLSLTTSDGKPFVNETRTVLEFDREAPFSWWNNIYSLLLILLVVVVANNKIITDVYLILLSVIGLLFCFTMTYSLHEELRYNYNVLLFNPLLLLLVYFQLVKSQKWVYRMSVILIGLIGIYLILVANKAHFLIVLPIIACNLIILFRLFKRSKISATTT